jgi:hypothetical protein
MSRMIWSALVCCALGSVAEAAPGDHIRVGNYTTIAPELETGVEFRTNSYLSVGGQQSTLRRDQAISSFNFMLSPSLGIHVDHPKVRFDLDGTYELRKYFDPELAERLDRFTDFNTRMKLDVLPRGLVGFRIVDNAVLRNRTSDNPFRPSSLLTQLRNDLSGYVTFRPGPDLDVEAGAGWAWHNYQVPGADAQRSLNTRSTAQAFLNVRWRFFPSTSFVFEGQYHSNKWATNWIPTGDTVAEDAGAGAVRSYGQFLAMPDSDMAKLMTGLRGRVTRSLVLTAMAGWGVARYDVESVNEESASDPGLGAEADPEAAGFDQNLSGIDGLLVLLKADLDIGYSEKRTFGQLLTLFYRKDFQDSFFTNYVHQNHLQLELRSRWGRYLRSTAGFGPRFEEYVGEVERRDIFLQGDLDLEFLPTDWMGIRLGGFWMQRASSQRDVQYDNVQAHLLLRFSY